MRDSDAGLAPLERDDEAQVRRSVLILLRRWWLLAAGMIAGALLGALASRTRPMYEAFATVLLIPSGDASQIFTGPGLQTVLTNQANTSDVLQQLGLDRPPYGVNTATFLRESVFVEQIPNAYFFRVKVRFEDPQLAARAATALAERGVELMARLWSETAATSPAQLEKQVEAARLALAVAEQTLAEYRKRNGVAPDSRSGGASIDTTLGRLEADAEITRRAYIETGARYEQARIEMALATPRLRLVDRAAPPQRPVTQPRNRLIALGVAAGLLAAACAALALEWRAGAAATSHRGVAR